MSVIKELRRTRDFAWGAVYISDRDDYDFDPDVLSGPGPVWSSLSHVTVATVCSRAVPVTQAQVELLVRVHDAPLPDCGHEALVDVPCGVLNIGDADEADDVELGEGRWRVQVNVDDADEPTYVELNLSRVPDRDESAA